MIGYLDTSAFVPLLIDEPTSNACRRFWDDADAIVSSRLLYVETAAALAQALRMGRLTAGEHVQARRSLDQMWSEMDVIEADEQLVLHAADLAHRLSLRGYDAVHCASAEQLDDDDVVAASADQRLLSAWLELGMEIYDTTQKTAQELE
ncbi:type II toxin-antitoxin system VapC family toxin [Mycobacterium malmoense]|uniref:type II toxin-antitoxin system VapC family toxin n=1 Tax=Mycobacterium malmoense TaxID=1780 RepID=UPI0008F970D5|nr:type II toxin-antitoxin system VapC family toxin [Mycobacterium malmoense]OIN81361.1 VapC toxin family PIN domain ribonuclease [Mycobacterium malmoense]